MPMTIASVGIESFVRKLSVSLDEELCVSLLLVLSVSLIVELCVSLLVVSSVSLELIAGRPLYTWNILFCVTESFQCASTAFDTTIILSAQLRKRLAKKACKKTGFSIISCKCQICCSFFFFAI